MTKTVSPKARTSPSKSSRVQLRTSDDENHLIREAAASTGETLSAFILSSAIARANEVLSDRRRFVIDGTSWQQFSEALERPATTKQRLRTLLTEPSVLDG